MIKTEQQPPSKAIKKAMQKIARRRPGKKKLVYDKATRTIIQVNQLGAKVGIGLRIMDDGADMF